MMIWGPYLAAVSIAFWAWIALCASAAGAIAIMVANAIVDRKRRRSGDF
jgi:hypothetical protein